MKIWVLKNSNATTRALVSGTPRDGWEEMEESDFIAWRDAQPPLVTEMPPAPEQVTRRQWRLYCRFDLGHADPDASVRAAIDQYVPADQRERAHIEYESATVIERRNPLVPLLAAALGIADVAQAFREMEEKYG